MKGHPQNLSVIDIPLTSRFMDFFLSLKREIDKDKMDRWSWVDKARRFHTRRYALDKRKPNNPFIGSADVWPPLTDMIIEQMKAMYLNLLYLSSPPVSALPLGEDEDDRAEDVERMFEYWMNYGSPQFLREQHFYVDDSLSCGIGFMKTYWEYCTRTAPETLKLSNLPDPVAERVVGKDLPEDMASLYMSERVFDQLAWKSMDIGGQVRMSTATLLEENYDLDRDEKIDKRAIDQILAWLRSGAKEPLTIRKRDTVIDAPATCAIMPENMILPFSATDIEDCFHVSQEMWLGEFQVRQRERDALWIPASTQQMLDVGRGADDPRFMRSGIQAFEAQRQGQNWSASNKYHVIESYTWYDYDEDGIDEKVRILWSPNAEGPLKADAFDSASGRWPVNLLPFERNKPGIYASRGIPERLMDIERELVVSTRAELNRAMISSSLSLLVRQGSPAANQNIQWRPGEKIIVNDIRNDIAPLQFPDMSVVFQQRERIWKVWAESSIGTPNYAISDPLSNLNEPRTAREISAIQTQGRSIGNVRTAIYREQMAQVFHNMFDLYQTLGPKEQWIAVTGSEPIKIRKEDLQGAYQFVLGPLVGMDDPTLEAQKALARVQILKDVIASGVVPKEWAVDFGEALRTWIRKDDPRAAKKIMRKRTPEEMQQMEQEQMTMDRMQGMLLGMGQGQQGQNGGMPQPMGAGK